MLSQVVLSMQLSFAIFPLMAFTSDRTRMGEFANPLWVKIAGYATCIVIAALNVFLIVQKATEKMGSAGIWGLAGLVGVALGFSAWVKWGYRERPAEA